MKLPLTYRVTLKTDLEDVDCAYGVQLIGGYLETDFRPDGPFTNELQWFLEDEMPEWIMSRIAALNMLDSDAGHHIKNVGRRLSPTTFWVDFESDF